jgi:hypothetical protein
MKRIIETLKRFFFPPPGTSRWLRVLPYVLLGVLTLALLTGSAYAWDYTNSPEFCGSTCHTMPPEFTSYLTSPHARVDCVECHIGRGFIAQRITRKAGDAKHIISLTFKDYEFPIRADELRPARETCERCHFPEKFSDDSLREIKRFRNDAANTPESTYLVLKTGGGTKRLGLGRGIHWHIENPVYFQSLDFHEQVIPYVRVVEEDGTIVEYLDIEADINPDTINPDELEEMDCITCHNRITHLILHPEDMVDQLINRGVVSPMIPEIRRKAIEIMYKGYPSKEAALDAIGDLEDFYRKSYSDFYHRNVDLVHGAVTALQESYDGSVYPEQKASWDTHPNNAGHLYAPGCFRCHDGKHLNSEGEAIRLECNLCHSIPVVAEPTDFIADIEISRGPEPENHLNPNWISVHHEVYDPTCGNCHTMEDPGGISDTSFCSNSACHGTVWEFAGFDAPGLRDILLEQFPRPTPVPTISVDEVVLTYAETIGPLFESRCGDCHSENGLQGLNLTTYEGVLAGGLGGPSIVPGDPDASLLIDKLTEVTPHFGQFNEQELEAVIEWIAAGAPEE